MAFQRPTLSQLVSRAQDDVNARLPGADSRMRQSGLGVLATVQAGAVHGVYGYMAWLADQILPDTAEGDILERHASARDIIRKPATLAAGLVTITGANGSVIPSGTVLQSAGGVEYVAQGSVTIAGGVAALPVAARLAGVVGVASAGTKLSFVSPIAGVASVGTVAGDGLTGGADQESDDLLRERLQARLRQPPAGGARHDYEDWLRQYPEVTRAWVYPGWMGAGTVGLTFMMDGRPDPFPTAGDLNGMRAFLPSVAPVGAELVVFAPIQHLVDVQIEGLNPDDPAVRAAVEAELVDLFYREGKPGGSIPLTHIAAAISQAAGEEDHQLVLPSASVTPPPGHLAALGALDFI